MALLDAAMAAISRQLRNAVRQFANVFAGQYLAGRRLACNAGDGLSMH
jgi:hypothetical protein